MTDYAKLSDDINTWLTYNEAIDKFNTHIKQIREKKNNLESTIISTMETHKLTNKKLKISDKHIYYNVSHTMPPLSLKLLESVLDEFMPPKTKEKIIEKIQLYRDANKTATINLKKKNAYRKKSTKKSA